MTRRSSASLCSIAVLCLLTCLGLITNALAQNTPVEKPRAKYAIMAPHLRPDVATPAASLQGWNGSFVYGGTTYTYNMVGSALHQTRLRRSLPTSSP